MAHQRLTIRQGDPWITEHFAICDPETQEPIAGYESLTMKYDRVRHYALELSQIDTDDADAIAELKKRAEQESIENLTIANRNVVRFGQELRDFMRGDRDAFPSTTPEGS